METVTCTTSNVEMWKYPSFRFNPAAVACQSFCRPYALSYPNLYPFNNAIENSHIADFK